MMALSRVTGCRERVRLGGARSPRMARRWPLTDARFALQSRVTFRES
jgi:hypothetical protein